MNRMRQRWLPLFLVAALTGAPYAALADGSTITGRILDTNGGLPVPNASIELDRGDTKVAETKTDAQGVFHFAGEPAGVYSVLINAQGYNSTRAGGIVIGGLSSEVSFQTAISHTTHGLREIGSVTASRNTSLQTSTTINAHVDPQILQDQNYVRSGDALATLPFVNSSTSSAVGDDLTLSIRGFNSTETATLLDGHPIGPVGAGGAGFDFQNSPFIGLSSLDVIYGTGATGIYGAATIAGAVNFQSINPTKNPHALVTFGIGNDSKTFGAAQYSGTIGKLGIAIAHGVEGTNGNFDPQQILQTGLLASSAVYTDPNGNAPPDISAANRAANTYSVSGTYNLRNDVLKLHYEFDPKTSVEVTGFSTNTYDDKSGNGDTDFNSFQEELFNANNIISAGPNSFVLPSGATATCNNSIAVKNDSASGFTCLNAQQYASQFSGPFGGGPGRFQTISDQDYHAKVTRQVGAGSVVVDGYENGYAVNVARSTTGPFQDDTYRTGGFLLSDEYVLGNNDVAFGYNYLHQNHYFILNLKDKPTLPLATQSYFVRDAWTPNYKLSVFGNAWVQRSQDTQSTNFDPRLSLVYRPDSNDVVRVTGGHSYSEPDPTLVEGVPVLNETASGTISPSFNPTCTQTPGANVVANGADPALKPETATDLELSLGHRFNTQTTIQADVYSSIENNAIFSGQIPYAALGIGALSPTFLQSAIGRIDASCGPGFASAANLGASTHFNAAQGRYRGIGLNGTVGLVKNITADAAINVQSASFEGIPLSVLKSNIFAIDGQQLRGIPLHQANLGLNYTNTAGFELHLNGYYVGDNNGLNRPAYSYLNANIAKTTHNITINFGVNNLFNSAAQNYGLIGLGPFIPENQFGTDTSPFQQGSEEFGLPYRQAWITVTSKI